MKLKEPALKYATIMLVDDNDLDNIINQKMLEGNYFAKRINIHTSSHSALEFLLNLDREKDPIKEMIPQVIFLDINMPLMNGFQFLDEYEKLSEEFRKKIKIVMLTTSSNPSDLNKAAKNKNVSFVINKPLTKEELAKI